jgi:hypothetical protein
MIDMFSVSFTHLYRDRRARLRREGARLFFF